MATAGDFVDYVVCTVTDAPALTGIHTLYWRAVTTYEYEDAVDTVQQRSIAWPLRLGAPNDVNGDGKSDVIIGATGGSIGGPPVLFYGASLTGDKLLGDADITFQIDVVPTFFTADYASMVGDVNGDGYQDFSLQNVNGASSKVYVVMGRATGSWPNPLSVSTDMGTANLTPPADGTQAWFGRTIAGADVNGDGVGDLIVGNYAYNSYQGEVVVFFGPIPGALSFTISAADLVLTGSTSAGRFGSAVANAGDVDGDGYEDLLIGEQESSTSPDTGHVYVVRGGPDLPTGTQSITSVYDLKIDGLSSPSMAGQLAAGIGDLDLDGYADLLVAGNAYWSTYQEGRASVILSPVTPSAPLSGQTIQQETGSYSTLAPGVTTVSMFGTSGAAGRFDADARVDLVVGTKPTSTSYSGVSYVEFDAWDTTGAVGMDASADVRLLGEKSSDYMGSPVANIGDIDGDGQEDLAVCAPTWDVPSGSTNVGRVYIIKGSALDDMSGNVTDLGTNANVLRITASAMNTYFGKTIGTYRSADTLEAF
jgi:hypothetical protein